MGWPLAVSVGLMDRSSHALLVALWPLTIGHLLAMLVVILPFALLLALVEWQQQIQIGASRQLLAEAIASGMSGDGFVPVAIPQEPAAVALSGATPCSERAIEIRLPNGIVIGVGNAVEVEPLRRVLSALSGR